MIVIVIYLILSFILDTVASLYISTDLVNPSYFRTIFSVIALVISYHYFDEDKKYLYLLIALGILFDITYTNTFLVNIFIFGVIYLIIKEINIYIPNNLFTINIKTLIAIITYHVLSYLLMLISHYANYPIKLLLTTIISNIIMTIIYTSISYLIIKKLYFYKYPKKIK